MQELDLNRLPRHVAIIMDGNGRWARERLRNRVFGHERGAGAVREVVRSCRKLGIPCLTLYAFSKENWRRPESEIKALWLLLERFLKSELPEMMEQEIRLRHIGDPEGIPNAVLSSLMEAVHRTSAFNKMVLNLAINYGGRQEIVRAARLFAEDVLRGRFHPEDLDPQRLSSYLFTAGLPDPDLVIRTGGEQRVSNFLLWQLAYAELYITPVMWPNFNEVLFMEALMDFQQRERRFGKTGDQIRSEDGTLSVES